jgi:hypothetical protein
MIKWITPPMYGFFLMMVYAGVMGKDGLKEYPIGDERPMGRVFDYSSYRYVITRSI